MLDDMYIKFLGHIKRSKVKYDDVIWEFQFFTSVKYLTLSYQLQYISVSLSNRNPSCIKRSIIINISNIYKSNLLALQ